MKTSKTNTGIYTRAKASANVTDPQFRELTKRAFNAANRNANLDAVLGKVKADAEAVLASGCPDVAKAEAQKVVAFLIALDKALASDNARTAAGMAFKIGRFYERMFVVPHEPTVVVGQKMKATAASGRDARAAATETKYQSIRDMVERERKRESRRPKAERAAMEEVYELVAQQFKCSTRTVLRALGKIRAKR